MVESAIFLGIGFLTAAFLALLAAPAISRRAARLAEARARLQAPLSETQARAERDALRGQHAVALVRLEKRVSVAEDDRAQLQIDLGRHATRIVRLEETVGDRDAEIARQRQEIAHFQSEERNNLAQLGAQEIGLRDLTFQRDRAEREFAAERERVLALETLADENRAAIATLETRAAGLDINLIDAQRASAAAARAAEAERLRLSAALAERMKAAADLRDDLAGARTRFDALSAQFDARTAEAAELRDRVAELEARLSNAEAGREGALLENSRQLARLADRDAALSKAEASRLDLSHQLAALADAAEAREAEWAHQVQELTTLSAVSGGALQTERGERSDLQREVESLRARLMEVETTTQAVIRGDQALRLAIARLGRDVVRAQSGTDEDEPGLSQVVTFARRDSPVPANQVAEPLAVGALRQSKPIASEG